MIRIRSGVIVSLLALLLNACGGSSSGSVASEPTGAVGVVLTDAPVLGYEQALATITAIELLGADGPVSIFAGEVTVDLLSLRDYQELFAFREDVPAGTYSKIRLTLKQLTLIEIDEATGAETATDVELHPSGKVDLNPQGPFTVAAGETLLITLDFDMEKTIKLTATGNGKLKLRPVIFIKISDHEHPDLLPKVARIHGVVKAIDASRNQFQLCNARRVAEVLVADSDTDLQGFMSACVLVVFGESTGFFGEDGKPVEFAALADGDPVTVIGRLTMLPSTDVPPANPEPLVASSTADAWDGDHDWHHERLSGAACEQPDSADDADACERPDLRFGFAAMVVERGLPGTFRIRRGETLSTVDAATEQFDLALGAGQGYEPGYALTVQLYRKSWILQRSNGRVTPIDAASITVAQRVAIDGVIGQGEQGEELRAALLLTGDSDAAQTDFLAGTIESIDALAGDVIISDKLGRMHNVAAATATVVVIELTDAGFVSKTVELGDLMAGQSAVVFGAAGTDGHFVATAIIAGSAPAIPYR